MKLHITENERSFACMTASSVGEWCIVCQTDITEINPEHTCGRCTICCICTTCPTCARCLPFSRCGSCLQCPRCCTCVQCRNCFIIQTVRNTCTLCGYGYSCCCTHGRDGGNMSRDLLFIKHKINLNRYVDPGKRLVAAEIELCGFNATERNAGLTMRKVMDKWHISGVRDGSVPGVELNTHPASGKFWVHQITDIMNAARLTKAWVDERAGCHIHTDCRDLSYLGLAKCMRLFACVEPALFLMIPKSRRNSHYCHFWAMNYLKALHLAETEMNSSSTERKVILAYRREILRAVYGFSDRQKVDAAKASKGHLNRYRALNIHSFLHRGTIEMRMPPGTIHAQNIINWGLLTSAIVDFGVAHSMVEVMSACKNVETSIREAGIFSTHINQLSKDFTTKSTNLLLTLAPSSAVKDWIVERQAWGAKTDVAVELSE